MLWFVFTTSRCNLQCTYCGNAPTTAMPADLEFTVQDLKKFIDKDPDPTICFYGGEPLLNHTFVLEVMAEIPAKFVFQTNGTLIHRLPAATFDRVDALLVSLDGRPDITNARRGKGVFEKVEENVMDVVNRGFAGHLVARMTVHQDSDIFLDVTSLFSGSIPFQFVHWQLDVQWDTEKDITHPNFDEWKRSYNEKITQLADWFIEEMKEGRFRGVVPFIGVYQSIKRPRRELLCGVGWNSFSIGTKGQIIGCPVSWDDRWNQLGHIDTHEPQTVPHVEVGEPCNSCDVREICTGRCLYANKTQWWGQEGFDDVCGTIKHLISEVKRITPMIEEHATEEMLEIMDNWDPCNFSLETIP
ncbi:hypothetical protein PCE1_000579 [Barthelona sp. PCE]